MTANPNTSLALRFAALPEARRKKILAALSPKERLQLEYTWAFWARPSQIDPASEWRTWLILAGRGWGKTRVGAEWIRKRAKANPASRIALVGATAADVRDVIIEGESGILAVCPPNERPEYEPSKRRITWKNGAIATAYSADEPDRLRGPQHTDAWADELASWRYPDAWDQLMFGLRLGDNPRVVVTTTPRPTPIIRGLVNTTTTTVTRGSTYENKANLAEAFIDKIVQRYAQTRLGRQEIFGEILDDNPGALFKRDLIEKARVAKCPPLLRIVIAIDPAVSSNPDSDETGIIVVGLGYDLHAYVLEDLSGKYTPAEWANVAVDAFYSFEADRIVAEVNQGGALVEANIRTVDPSVPYKAVRASRGKAVRAEPVAGLYEQGRVHHVGVLVALEDQMVSWDPTQAISRQPSKRSNMSGGPLVRSPDRMDGLVWGITELLLEQQLASRELTHLPPG
jgi:phage terminase large subunit-like protein